MKMMKTLLLATCLLSPLLANAADHPPYKVLMLLYRGSTDAERGFMDYLKARMPVQFIVRDAAEDKEKIPALIAEARQLKPDLIYTFGTSMTLAAVGKYDADPARYLGKVPVVFNIVADPVGSKLTRTLQTSSRNFTGVSHLVPMADQLKAANQLGKINRLGVVYNPQEPNSQLAVRDLQDNAARFGYTLVPVPVEVDATGKPTTEAVTTAVQQVLLGKIDTLYLPSDSSLIQQADAIVAPATAAGVPVISATEAPIRKNGALMGLVGNYYNAGAFAGYKAEQILLKRKTPAAIPMETLQRFSLVVNMQTARTLKRYPPLEEFRIAELLR
ncbi:putative ABC transport system substrate-binding protein [Andreprevotia lacus DSM 23236]|jgi:putative ABC transport system substrate-binding protein|uniref:Putative ABC transport system substrate-binding protein n=1 Tax=Andreprevotia lacus DSM 23236 TaxID=1121001 RepID=A0A1W1XGG4_9NEIS|nr:ABC transporter substrate-binding protein [Andreprevotia lacus]SMC22882.1 putative ABC transport system substrate-binding protein [Andreprevotia lacus DSM 23236]